MKKRDSDKTSTRTKQDIYYPKFDNARDYEIFTAGVAMCANAILECGGQTAKTIIEVLNKLREDINNEK